MRKILLFGSTGDLAKKKILPALASLQEKKLLNVPIIAVGRKDLTKDQYLKMMQAKLDIEYIKTDFKTPLELKDDVIAYLATSPDLFVPIIKLLNSSKMKNVSVAFEKPFGSSLESAKTLYKEISKYIPEGKMFFSDHYLGKDIVYNIPEIKKKLDKIIEIRIELLENFGIEGRGEYYDKSGVIKDIIQNHVMQIISLLIDNNNKAKVISSLKKPSNIVLGQYEGYTKEVKKDSNTETFISFETKYKNVPIYVKAGKNLNVKSNDIFLKTKDGEANIHLGPENPQVLLNNKKIYSIEKKADYENIFLALIKNDESRFATWPEIKASWEFTDKLVSITKGIKKDFPNYKPGSKGPIKER